MSELLIRIEAAWLKEGQDAEGLETLVKKEATVSEPIFFLTSSLAPGTSTRMQMACLSNF